MRSVGRRAHPGYVGTTARRNLGTAAAGRDGFVACDAAQRFRFTPIQSDYGTRLAQAFGIDPDDPDTNAVVHGEVAWFKSDAALTVLSNLPGWGWTRALFWVPKLLRDTLYSLVARNRYRIFGKYEQCFVPDASMRARVLE